MAALSAEVLLELVLFCARAAAITTVVVMVRGMLRARLAQPPARARDLIGAGWLTGLIVHDPVAAIILPLFGVGAVIETRRHLPKWSFLAAQLLSALLVGSVVYLIYAGAQPFVDRLGLLGIAGSFVVFLFETSALAQSVYYLSRCLQPADPNGASRRAVLPAACRHPGPLL